MTVEEHYDKAVETVHRDAPVNEAAHSMRSAGVGCVVVLDADDRPVGMLTDRDLTMRIVAGELDPGQTRVSDVMTSPVHTVGPSDSIDDVLELMAKRGIRRAPVVRNDRCAGLVSVDDVLLDLARSLENLAKTTLRRVRHTRRHSRMELLATQLDEHVGDAMTWMGEQGQRVGQAATKLARDLRDMARRDPD